MNKRPHSGLGLPAKPMGPPQGGPAPPYPAGQPPQQQYTPDQHAAAWAAYYQANPQAAQQAGYSGGGAAAQADSSASNPYANYGYGAGASHAQGYSGQQQQPQQQLQQPPQQGYQNQNQNQNQNYNQQPQGHNYQQGYGQGGYNANAGYNQQQQGYGNWGGQQSPPSAGQYQAPQNPTAGGYTPQNNQYYGQGQGQGSYSPSPSTPGFRPPQNRPYQPQPGGPGPGPGRGGQARPPASGPHPPAGASPGGPGGPGAFPPAKRPRFDGPGGGPGGGGGMALRPPNARPPPGYGSGLARPMNDRGGGGGGRGGAPPPPIPRIGFGAPQQRPQRGGMRGGGPMARGGGMMGRGTSIRQRDQREMRPPRTQRVEVSPQQARKRKDKEAKEARTTMTDFRIVGIEVKGLDWSWGLVGEHVVDVKDEKSDDIKSETEVKEEVKEDKADDKPEPEAAVKPEPEEEAKPGSDAPDKEEATDTTDEKRGEKRKARKSSVDGDEAQSPKKRSFILTHNKINAPGDGPSPESNQNRFRIYFESPPELDRVPKSARRNPNKRWRRESTTLEETVVEETHEEAQGQGADTTEAATAQQLKHDSATDMASTVANGNKPTEEAPAEAKTEAPAEAKTEAPAEAKTEAPAEAKTEAPSEPTEPAAAPATTERTPEPASEAVAPAEKETPAKGAEDKEEAGDVSMVTDAGTVEGAEGEGEEHEHTGLTGAEASAAEVEAALVESAQNAASAYGSRQKPRARGWSTSSIGSDAETDITALTGDVAHPSVNRVSVLYEDSTRRLVFDASVVRKIRIFRSEGRIEVDVQPPQAAKEAEAKEGDKEAETETELPKGVLVEAYDSAEQRFMAISREKLDALWKDEEDKSLPPLHRVFGCTTPAKEPITLTVFLNKKKPLSEPKWCRTNQADEWLYEQFGRRAASEAGWRGKLEIMDPDAPPTLANILETWKGGSNVGTAEQRNGFTTSLLASPNDLLEILIRLTRGDRNPTAAVGTGPTSANGPLATAIRPDSPYASHQTHVSLAILAMYRLTTDYAEQAGKTAALNDQIADIIRSLPAHMIHRSLEGLYKEWLAERRG
ncbi:hypothetical protein CcaverHIS002_0200930 [Cutaneotrichosporon cavernicola]|nr:hypothetical protein CcaverHIS002_0200930 [Cutaneotrichosporon cavernicola]BEI96510.1 hypothetical protein CcaverHIS631_0200990 [Cutaneotrichosporon cavernicola]BEJ04282.1 hypothetical protein CcaverHIS641_0200990 [Cutaneotrichosporon cavernicola]